MKHFPAAVTSSLKALTIDPEDPIAKQIMARVSRRKKIIIIIFCFY
jgi:hypothetical protein